MPDLTVTATAVTGPRAFAEAGVRPDQIDVAIIYDSFTITVLLLLEDLGFCKKGEGGAFVQDGRIALGWLMLSVGVKRTNTKRLFTTLRERRGTGGTIGDNATTLPFIIRSLARSIWFQLMM